MQTVKLSELYEGLYDGPHATPKPAESGPVFLGIKNITEDGRLDLTNIRHISENEFSKWTKRVTPQAGDIVFSYEATLHRYAIIPEGFHGCLGRRMALIRPNKDKVNTEYLFNYFFTDQWRTEVRKYILAGATVDRIPLTKVPDFEVTVHERYEQDEVAEAVSNYNNLIENNNRRIAILEDMAQSLYREWFIKFRFPGHENVKFKDSPLGQIPEGWEVKVATDVIEFAPKMTLPKDGEKPFVAMPSISTSSMIIGDIEMRSGNSGTKFKNGDTLMARITPCLQNGKIGFVQFLDEENPIGFGSTEFIVMRSKGLTPEFVYCLARSDSFRGNAINSMAGADGRQRVKNDCFKSYYLAVPPKEIFDKFSALAEPAFKEVSALNQKNKILRRQRDMLLPKLISGDIAV